jgi:transcriptional regulator with XRE-family HTH domain
MAGTASPGGEADGLSVGSRLKVLRTRRGMTRDVLGGLVGRSASWVKAVEIGRIAVPRLPMLLRLAEALEVQDLAELTGAQSVPITLFAGPGHSRLPAVRAAVNQLVMPTDRPAPPVWELQTRLRQAWAARHAAPNHREVVGALLPGLLTDARMLAQEQVNGPQRRESLAVLAGLRADAVLHGLRAGRGPAMASSGTRDRCRARLGRASRHRHHRLADGPDPPTAGTCEQARTEHGLAQDVTRPGH